MEHLRGWVNQPHEVERVWNSMPTPFFATPDPDTSVDAHNHLIFKEMTGDWHDEGPQEIGDCVSWGNGRLVDYTQVLEEWLQLKQSDSPKNERYDYQKTATEVIYALSRVEVGGGRLSGDGSVGAWAAKALTDFGSISRAELDRLGVGGRYSGARARQWGRSGLPDSLEPAAKNHIIADMTPVRNFKEFAWHCQNYRVTAVCSDVGFENGPNGTTERDFEGFATPRGSWGHCMCLVSVRFGRRPGGLLTNQWPKGTVSGPTGPNEIPPCSWWVDAEVIDRMLGQGDSFTGTKYKGYPIRPLTFRF
jgi:hypothetical protein